MVTRFNHRRLLIVCSTLALLAGCAVPESNTCDLYLNDIQRVASHNSYKKAMLPERFAALSAVNPDAARSLEYAHSTLETQLDLGLGKLELDVFYDPEGNRYGVSEPGFRVMHVQNLDDQSHCTPFADCLSRLRQWSLANSGHLPIAVSINAKDQVIDQPGFTKPLSFDESAWRQLDATIERLLGDRLIRPADVISDGQLSWPCVSDTNSASSANERGRNHFLFVLDEGGEKLASYTERWSERAMFANLPAEHPGAAFMIINDPVADFDRIRRMVELGFLVRTRADADTAEARRNDTARREAAFSSGAHFVSTDYYLPATHFGNDYVVRLPDNQSFRRLR